MFLILIARKGNRKLFWNGLFKEFQRSLSLCCLYDYSESDKKILENIAWKLKEAHSAFTFEVLSVDLESLFEALI